MFAQPFYEKSIGYRWKIRYLQYLPMDYSFSIVFRFWSRFTIRSTITEMMDLLVKSRFASLYELFGNRLRIASVTDVKIKFALHWCQGCVIVIVKIIKKCDHD